MSSSCLPNKVTSDAACSLGQVSPGSSVAWVHLLLWSLGFQETLLTICKWWILKCIQSIHYNNCSLGHLRQSRRGSQCSSTCSDARAGSLWWKVVWVLVKAFEATSNLELVTLTPRSQPQLAAKDRTGKISKSLEMWRADPSRFILEQNSSTEPSLLVLSSALWARLNYRMLLEDRRWAKPCGYFSVKE